MSLVQSGKLTLVRLSVLHAERLFAASIVLIGAMLVSDQARSAPVFDTYPTGSPKLTQAALAHSRAMAVDHMVGLLKSADIQTQLAEVNRFFNHFEYRSDIDLWGKSDYWASAMEFIERGAGDCEDYAIGKYAILRALGVPDERLAITYVRDLRVNNWHMVLLYRPSGEGQVLVLDGRDPAVRPLAERTDLVPVYGFNTSEVMVLNRLGQSRTAAPVSSAGHREWKRVLAGMGTPASMVTESEYRAKQIRIPVQPVKTAFRRR